MGSKTMIEKRMIDAHMENFNFETLTEQQHFEWIEKLQLLLAAYRQVRGR